MRHLLLLLIALAIACGTTKNESSDEAISLDDLKDEVMAIHDEVMPKMGDIRRLRKDLMLQADSLLATDSVRANALNSMADRLEAANEGMMNWMRSFEMEFEGTDEEIRNYFEEQKKAISLVKEDMLSAMEKGKEVLGN